jgi:hypothetical protein
MDDAIKHTTTTNVSNLTSSYLLRHHVRYFIPIIGVHNKRERKSLEPSPSSDSIPGEGE